MRRLSKENRDATEALELEISDLVRQLKLTPAGARKDELAAQLKERQQRLKTVREEFRRKLQELMGNASPGTELPEIITQGPKPPHPSVSISLDSFFEESFESHKHHPLTRSKKKKKTDPHNRVVFNFPNIYLSGCYLIRQVCVPFARVS
uniref:Uncharacterized protein n=1 Tax=Ixodes ricinus TaxID=34613 RepID=A0A090XD89_IXORI